MSRIIAFAHTTPALVCNFKHVTRRPWDPAYAASFRVGEVCQAWNHSPRCGKKAYKVGEIRLTHAVTSERTADAPESDFAGEGFAFLQKLGHTIALDSGKPLTPADLWLAWKDDPRGTLFVVRFELLSLTINGAALRESYMAAAANVDAQPKLFPFGDIPAPKRNVHA